MASKDFKNGRIYCIRNMIDDDIYVGSTCQPISKRMPKHRENRNYKNNRNMKLYVKMRDIGVDNFYIELIEECPCDNLEQLRRREGHFIRERATLNQVIAGRTVQEHRKEYYIANKEHLDTLNKEYSEAHPERMKKYKHEWYERNKEEQSVKQKERYEENKEEIRLRNRIYKEQNKDKLRDQNKARYEKNKDKISQWKHITNTCECGGRFTNGSK